MPQITALLRKRAIIDCLTWITQPMMDPTPPDGISQELDARGLECPLPILRTKKCLNDLRSGQILRVLATDPGSMRDFHAFSRQTGHELLDSGDEAGAFFFVLRKK